MKEAIMQILLVEDNEFIIKALKYLLEQNNFQVTIASTRKEAFKNMNNAFDLMILDLMLPDGSGLDIFKENNNIPTLILSAKDEEDTVVNALNLGVEDYIIKPFRSQELLSRINRILKRQKGDPEIKYENLVINLERYQIFSYNQEVKLTALEWSLLNFLLKNHNIVVKRELIMEKIWDESGKFVNDNTLSVYIKRLRHKLKNEHFITTIKGVGYKIDL